MKQPHLLTNRALVEFMTVEGCSIVELLNGPEDPGLSVAQARVAPGVCTQWHALTDTTERYVVLSGEAEVEVGDLPAKRVVAQDVIIIPPGVRQRIRNTGQTDLLFLAVCTPRFTPEAYVALAQDPQ